MRIRSIYTILLALTLISIATTNPASAVVVTEYALPRASALPEDLAITRDTSGVVTTDANSGVFVTESSLTFGNRIARLGPIPTFGTWTEWLLPSSNSQPWGLDVNPGNTLVAFTEFQGNRIGILRLSDNALTEIPLPRQGSGPRGIAWINSTAFAFAEFAGTRIGIFNICFNPPSGGCGAGATPALAEWWPPVEYGTAGIWNVAVDSASNSVWYTEFGSNRISRINLLSKAVTQFVIPESSGNAGPTGVKVDRDGNVWVTAQLTNKIYRLSPFTGTFTQYTGLSPSAQPYGVSVDNQGKVWFAESGANKIGVLNPVTNIMREIPIPTANAARHMLRTAADSSGTNIIFFAENGISSVGRVLEGSTAGPATVTVTTNPFSGLATTSSLRSSTTTTVPTLSDIQTGKFATSVSSAGTSFTTTLSTSQSVATSGGTSLTDTVQILETSTSVIVTSFIGTTSGVQTTTSTSTLLTTSATTTTTATATSTTTSLTTAAVTSTALTSSTQSIPITATATATAVIPAPTPIPGFPPWALVLGFVVATIGLVARRHRLRHRG